MRTSDKSCIASSCWAAAVQDNLSCLAGQAAIASPILHRNLKSPNRLVDKHGWVQAVDFKLSTMLHSDADL